MKKISNITLLIFLFLGHIICAQDTLSDDNIEKMEVKQKKLKDSINYTKELSIAEKYKLKLENKTTGKLTKSCQLRTEPNNYSKVITTLEQGTIVDVFNFFSSEYSCYAIRYNGQIGFIPAGDVMSVQSKAKKSKKYDTKPRLVYPYKPRYPKIAKKNKIEGKVILKVHINKKGKVTESIVSKGIPELNQAAMEAVLKYKFRPAKLKGEAVDVWIPIGISFKL